jgi:hypothetical protein
LRDVELIRLRRDERGARRPRAVIGEPLHNSLEPAALYDDFIAHPPEGFEARWLGTDAAKTPVFMTPFDLLTTLDDAAKRNVERIPFAPRIASALLRPRTIFAGTTVSEYAIYPPCEDFIPLVELLLGEMRSCRARLAILKDVPHDSPLLSARENLAASRLLEACRARGFIVLEGQALAYVPIDFGTEDEYLTRFSGKRRYDIRRKLKNRSTVRHEEVPAGDPRFDDDDFVRQLYGMYEEVFAQSEIHFDKLSRDFFANVFRRHRLLVSQG